MKRRNRIFSSLIAVVVLAGMFSFAPGVFAAESGTQVTDGNAARTFSVSSVAKTPIATVLEDQGQQPGENVSPDEPSKSKTFQIKVTQATGGTVTVDKDSITEDQIKQGELITVTITPDKGYGVTDLLINGKSVGVTGYTYTFEPTEETTTVKAKFHKSSEYLFIMLDAGHYGKVNKSPVLSSYYESQMTWPLHLYLKEELEKYQNVAVATTRAAQSKDMAVYNRGTASKGYDLFLSLHSNATSSKTTDYPLVITQKGNTSDSLAKSLGQAIQKTMGTKQDYKVWQKLNSDKKTEYYGVLRGAKAVGTKGMILEHSFHTNLAAAKWLSEDENLKAMAKAEADVIAAYYGLSKTGSVVAPSKPGSFTVSNTAYNALTLKWRKSANAQGYFIYRATSKNGTYSRVKIIKNANTTSWKNTSLTCGKTYYYKIRAYRQAGTKKKYSGYTAIKSCKTKPATPSVSSTAGKKRVTVKWNKVAGATRYVVYRATTKNGKYKKIATLKSNRRSYVNKKLKSKKAYYYKMRVYRTVNGKNYYSNYSGYTMKKTK
ncbi:hypothetical protein D3Z38_09465 [Clostridiales bacterium]|nr:hypothetical protein [Clostridiales bacterium]